MFGFIQLEAVISRLSIFTEKSLWSGSGKTLAVSSAEDALTDFNPNANLGSTKLSIEVKIASCTLVSVVANKLLTSLPVLLFSSVYIYLLERRSLELSVMDFSTSHPFPLCSLFFQTEQYGFLVYHEISLEILYLAENPFLLLSFCSRRNHS